MLIHPISITGGLGLIHIVYCAVLWLAGMLLILFHRSGIQVLGALIISIGFFIMVFHSRLHLAMSLMLVGFVLHGIGRLLMHLKRRG